MAGKDTTQKKSCGTPASHLAPVPPGSPLAGLLFVLARDRLTSSSSSLHSLLFYLSFLSLSGNARSPKWGRSEQQRLAMERERKEKKTQGKCSGNCFHFVKDAAILFPFCVGHGQPQLFTRFNTDRTTNGFSLLCLHPPQPQTPFFPRQLCGHYVHS